MKTWITYITAGACLLAAACTAETETVYKPNSSVIGFSESDELAVSFSTGENIFINGNPVQLLSNNQISMYEVPGALEYQIYYPEPTSREGALLDYTMPATQTYAGSGAIDKSVSPLYTVTDNDGMNDVRLKMACGALKLVVPQPADEQFASVKSIKLRSTQYVLAGDIRLNTRTGETKILGNAVQSLAVKGSIDISSGAEVVFVLPPLTFRDELEVTLTSTKGSAVCYVDLTGEKIESGKALTATLETVDWVASTKYYGKANSIVVAPGSTSVTVDCAPYNTTSLLYAYENIAGDDDDAARSVKQLWNDVSADFVSNLQLAANGKSFTANLNGQPGNAVIAIYDNADPDAEDANILWSFHIWVTDVNDQVLGENSFGNNYTLLDRNLGAVSITPGDFRANGLLYEWGRKDPFVSGSAENGSTTQNTRYDESGTLSTHTIEKGGTTTGTVAYATQHPANYIMSSRSSSNSSARPYYWKYDWLSLGDESLWGNPEGYNNPKASTLKKTIYDPCPAGYMVAPNDVWALDESTSVFPTEFGEGEGWLTPASGNKGLLVTINGYQTWYPAAGIYNRTSGKVQDVGVDASVWKSCATGDKKPNMGYIIVKGATPTVWGKDNCRGNAYSVRCVKTK